MKASTKKAILFRLVAIVLGLSPLLVAEVVCHVFDWGRATRLDDPYVGFSKVQPLFELNAATKRYEIPPARLTFFCAESFAAKKADKEFRIFVLGGSTVQGRPFQKETSFTTWLELSLRAADRSRRWEVVNCGGISYASYRLVPILQEVLDYQPDLIIVCTGHNEFLEDRTYDHIKRQPAYLTWPAQQLTRLRTYNLLRGAWLQWQDSGTDEAAKPVLGPEVDALLDPVKDDKAEKVRTLMERGLAYYKRDEDWRRGVQEHFRFNLRRMCDIATKAAVPLFFVCPVSNLDWPPFKSQHRKDLTEDERREFVDRLVHVRENRDAEPAEVIGLLHEARDIDERFALVHYHLGKRYLLAGDFRFAKQSLERALEEDICPLRMLPAMRADMKQIATETGTPVLDAHELFVARSPGGVTGVRWMLDHVHPTIDGHQLIAAELVQMMARQKLLTPSAWEAERDRAYEKHLQSLKPSYFTHGQARLIGLLRWANGKARYVNK